MNYKKITYYSDDRVPLSLKKLHYNRFYNMTDIFIAVDEAQDYEELHERLKKVLSSELSVRKTTERYICFSVDENYLKFKMKQTETL